VAAVQVDLVMVVVAVQDRFSMRHRWHYLKQVQ
jgi:hypothetical protein